MGTDGKAFSMFMTDRFTVNEINRQNGNNTSSS